MSLEADCPYGRKHCGSDDCDMDEACSLLGDYSVFHMNITQAIVNNSMDEVMQALKVLNQALIE